MPCGPWLASPLRGVDRVSTLWGSVCYHVEREASRFIRSMRLAPSVASELLKQYGIWYLVVEVASPAATYVRERLASAGIGAFRLYEFPEQVMKLYRPDQAGRTSLDSFRW